MGNINMDSISKTQPPLGHWMENVVNIQHDKMVCGSYVTRLWGIITQNNAMILIVTYL